TNEKYDQARAGQAYPYFMPWLSGENGTFIAPSRYSSTHFFLSRFFYFNFTGETTAGDPSTFVSITELQYDRIVKWSKGEFHKDAIPPEYPPVTIDELSLQDRPAALTKAALEATI